MCYYERPDLSDEENDDRAVWYIKSESATIEERCNIPNDKIIKLENALERISDNIGIEPYFKDNIGFESIKRVLPEETYAHMFYGDSSNIGLIHWTHYRKMIVERWCHQLLYAGFEADMTTRRKEDIARAVEEQEQIEMYAFSKPFANTLRENGNTDNEILKIMGVDKYEKYCELGDNPESSYTIKELREKILIN